MRLHTDPVRQAWHEAASPCPTNDWRRLYREGRRTTGLRRLRPYRVELISGLWRTMCPRAPQSTLSGMRQNDLHEADLNEADLHETEVRKTDRRTAGPGKSDARETDLRSSLRELALHIARHVIRRTCRASTAIPVQRNGRHRARTPGRAGAFCGGTPAAARDGMGR